MLAGKDSQLTGSINTKPSKAFFSSPSAAQYFFQPFSKAGQLDDPFEQEAESVALHITQPDSLQSMLPSISPMSVQRKCEHCENEEKEKLQRKANGNSEAGNESLVSEALQSEGEPLSLPVRSFMEDRFSYDFSKVKVHQGALATKSAQAVNALAYTSGHNIVFNEGQYSPETHEGKKLLAHELTHVVQQCSADTSGGLNNNTIQRFPGCTPSQNQTIRSALTRAKRRSTRAIQAVANIIDGSSTAALPSLRAHFGAVTPAQIGTIHSRMVTADNKLNDNSLWQCDDAATYTQCGPPHGWCAGTGCPDAGAVTHLCPPFFQPESDHACAEPSHAILVQHEALRAAGACGGFHPPGDRTPPGSLINVYSYSRFMYSIASGSR